MHRLINVVKPYAWGSRAAIAGLQGRPVPSAGPEAELWMGAHPSAPSTIEGARGRVALDARIAAAPTAELGEVCAATFGPRLPFLLKVLAAAAPLSLQAHPSLAQAQAGYAREDALGIALDAASRTFKDENHKPEVLCALTPFWALSGFRPIADALAVFRAIGAPELAPFTAILASPTPPAERLRAVFLALFAHPEPATLARAVVRAVDALAAAGYEHEARWTAKLGAEYPGDVGVAVALLLNLVCLAPGQALFLDAGNLHAYLEGTGIELMASSDNVLRGGLTVKHVDVAGLAEVLSFEPGAPPRATRVATPEGAIEYRTTAREFCLARVELHGAERTLAPSVGPEILLVTRGEVQVTRGDQAIALGRGESMYIAHAEAPLGLRGSGTLFRATTALHR